MPGHSQAEAQQTHEKCKGLLKDGAKGEPSPSHNRGASALESKKKKHKKSHSDLLSN